MKFFKKAFRKIKYYAILLLNHYMILVSKKKLKKYHNKYEGKRCFVIGNGPSLKTEDLEKLSNEITFASNGIYFVFNKTKWRPTYYCVQDCKLINNRYKEIIKNEIKSQKFVGLVKNYKYPLLKSNDIKVELIVNDFGEEGPNFSDNATEGLFEGWTVSYFSIQLAAYMGFKDIYLLGVDHSYGTGKDHFSNEDVCDNLPRTDKTTFSYVSAKKYSDKSNINIYNATRGGKLEVFPRVNFEDIDL